MFEFKNFVPANEIWPGATACEWKGVKPGLFGGFCIEVVNWKGETYWRSCDFTSLEPEEFFNNDFYEWMYDIDCLKPTGRISFRGYYIEEYDRDDVYYIQCDEDGNCVEK